MIKLNLENSDIIDKDILKYKEKVAKIHKDLEKRADNIEDFVRLVKTSNQL